MTFGVAYSAPLPAAGTVRSVHELPALPGVSRQESERVAPVGRVDDTRLALLDTQCDHLGSNQARPRSTVKKISLTFRFCNYFR